MRPVVLRLALEAGGEGGFTLWGRACLKTGQLRKRTKPIQVLNRLRVLFS